MGTRPMPITVAVVLQALFSLANLFIAVVSAVGPPLLHLRSVRTRRVP